MFNCSFDVNNKLSKMFLMMVGFWKAVVVKIIWVLDIYYAYDLWLWIWFASMTRCTWIDTTLLDKSLSGTCDWFGSYLRHDIGFVSYLRQVTVGFSEYLQICIT